VKENIEYPSTDEEDEDYLLRVSNVLKETRKRKQLRLDDFFSLSNRVLLSK
jgi:hypothetical protein